jgi:putative ABC transport system permease protein
MFLRLPLAWLQLTYSKTRVMVAIVGVGFANILMFMQFGFQDALLTSATVVQRHLRGELVLTHPSSQTMSSLNPFPRRRLSQVEAVEGVHAVKPMYVDVTTWKNPWDRSTRGILTMGLDPTRPALELPGVREHLGSLKMADVVLFDAHSRPEFGPVASTLSQGTEVIAEMAQRRITVIGLFRLGASFSADGNIITSDLNFLRIFKHRHKSAVDIGVVELDPEADVGVMKQRLQACLSEDVRVLTRDEFARLEGRYWEESTGIGFIFGQGVILGFIVGLAIIYQILYTDVAHHLSQYAALKAIGYTNTYLLRVVFEEAFLLALFGYVPGLAAAWGFFQIAQGATGLPMAISAYRAVMVLILTVAMCSLSGTLAIRKLRTADPASIF